MRVAVMLLIGFGLPALAPAQTRIVPPRISGPLPSIGLPLPRITPLLSSIGIPRRVDSVDPALAGEVPRPHEPHRRHGSKTHVRHGAAIVYFAPYFWGGLSYRTTSKPRYLERDVYPERAAIAGILRLTVEPAALVQIYADGFFVGTPFDLNGELTLDEGTHRIELRAPGYQPVSFDVRIEAGRTITYRASLQPLAPAPDVAAPVQTAPPADASPSQPAAKTTVYLIPGCYLGNVPPEAARLPETCDVSKVTTFQP